MDKKTIEQLQALYEDAVYRMLQNQDDYDALKEHRMIFKALCTGACLLGMSSEDAFRMVNEPIKKGICRYVTDTGCSAEEAAAMVNLVMGGRWQTIWR